MTELQASVILNLKGNLARKAKRDAAALEAVGKRGSRSMKALSRTADVASRSVHSLGGRFTALVAGVSAVAAGKQIIDFDARLASIGARAGKTGKALDKFVTDTKKRFFDLAKLPEISLNPDEVEAAADKIIVKTGDIELALGQLANIGLAVRGGEAKGGEAGALIADLAEKFDIKTVKGMTASLGDLTAQGDQGSFEFKDWAENAERLSAKFSLLGRTGRGALREAGALVQMFKTTTGDPAVTVTSVERFIDTITSEKAGELRKAGIQLFERDRQGRRTDVFRSSIDILKDIIRKADEIATKRDVSINEVLSKVFDIRAFRGVTAFSVAFQKAKRRGKSEEAFKKVDQLLDPTGGESLLRRRSKDLSRRPKAKVQRGKTIIREKTDALLGPFIEEAAEVVSEFEEGRGLKGLARRHRSILSGQGGAIRLPAVRGKVTLTPELLRELQEFQRRGGRIAGPLEESAASQYLGDLREGLEAVRRGAEERVSGKITIEIEAAPGLDARLKAVETQGLELEVDTGQIMGR